MSEREELDADRADAPEADALEQAQTAVPDDSDEY